MLIVALHYTVKYDKLKLRLFKLKESNEYQRISKV